MDSADIKHELQEMDEYEFEYLVADLWELDGWETTVSQASNDNGIDVTAVKRQPFNRKELIQAKRYSDGTSVGGPDIQQYASLQRQEPGVDSVAIVTTSTFTQSAERMAENLNVKTVDGDNLIEWIEATEENVLAEYVDGSVSNPVSSGDVPKFTETDLAEKIADHPANQSDESLEKIEKLRKMYKEHVELKKESNESTFIDLEFEIDGDISYYYQLSFNFHGERKLSHNLTGISEKGAARVRSLAGEEELEIREDEAKDKGRHIEVMTENCKKRQYQGYYDIWIATRILHEGYGVEFEDILRAGHHGYISEFAWNEMSPSDSESSGDTRYEESELSAGEQAEKLARKATSKSVTVNRLMGRGKRFFDADYLHERTVIEHLKPDESPKYFFYNESKGVRIDDEVIKSGWNGEYRNSILVTNKGVHFFVGRANNDFHKFLDYDLIEGIEARLGIIKKRLIFETEDKTYSFPVTPEAAADEIRKVGNYDNAQNV